MRRAAPIYLCLLLLSTVAWGAKHPPDIVAADLYTCVAAKEGRILAITDADDHDDCDSTGSGDFTAFCKCEQTGSGPTYAWRGISELSANSVGAAEISTLVKTISWSAGALSGGPNGLCVDAVEVIIGSWAKQWTMVCADSSVADFFASVKMPDGWDAGTLVFHLSVIQDAADTLLWRSDVSARCVGDTETPGALGTEQALDGTMTGSDAIDVMTSSPVTAAGTCAGGDRLQVQVEIDLDTTTAMATAYIVNFSMEYTWNPED